MAGLAAARQLHRSGFELEVFESRDRLGGRILTRRDERLPVPIELGAEFIHGAAPRSRAIGHDARSVECAVDGNHWMAARGLVGPEAYWDPVDRVLTKLRPFVRDESFKRFLERREERGDSARDLRRAREFVEGFHAADPEILGARSIAPNSGELPSASARCLARFLDGYDRLPGWLARDLADRVHLDARVTAIDWRKGSARLTVQHPSGEHQVVTARAVILTVPIGVLQESPGQPGALALRPDPPVWRTAIDRLAMGQVIKLVLLFDSSPWEVVTRADEGPARVAMLHVEKPPFRVWWTTHPVAAPLAVAWCGGPDAAALARLSTDARIDLALGNLAATLRTTRPALRRRLRGAWHHDWMADPSSRGAYSYATVGGSGGPKQLTRPIEGTLFLAGEASDVEGGTGTVEGAIVSGEAAARRVIGTLKR